MINQKKRIGALLMALVMIFSMFPTSVFAVDDAAEETPVVEEVVEAAAPVEDAAPAEEVSSSA